MPVERQDWVPQATLDGVNARLRPTVRTLDISARVDALDPIVAATVLRPTYPRTHADVDTTAGSLIVTLPLLASVPGYVITVTKLVAANTLTVDGGAATINGAADLAWTTRWHTYAFLAGRTEWRIVGAYN